MFEGVYNIFGTILFSITNLNLFMKVVLPLHLSWEVYDRNESSSRLCAVCLTIECYNTTIWNPSSRAALYTDVREEKEPQDFNTL
jgi:hypothetical protein